MTTFNSITVQGVVVRVPDELDNSTTLAHTDHLKIILMTYGPDVETTARTYQYYAIQFTKNLKKIVDTDLELSTYLKGKDEASLMKELLNLRLLIKQGQMDSGTINFYKTSAKNPDELLFAKPVIYIYTDKFKITGTASPQEREELLYVFNNWGNSSQGYGAFP